ncbi:MAG: S1C family serine protease [Acidimicrobiales bacterium]
MAFDNTPENVPAGEARDAAPSTPEPVTVAGATPSPETAPPGPAPLSVPARPRGEAWLVRAAAAAVLVLSIGGVGFVLGHWVDRPPAPAYAFPYAPSGPGGSITVPGFGTLPFPGFGFGSGAPGSAATQSNSRAARVAARVSPGLVDIVSTYAYAGATGEGTGMILTRGGLVLTNNHVIEGASSISVRSVATGQTYPATVVGYDVSADVALLQIQGASNLPTVRVAATEPSIGDRIVGIGNAGGVGGTPSYAAGKVVALNQTITASDENNPSGSETLSGLIEINADIQPGDSGGPLVNARGRVVGMDTAGSSTNGGFGFAPTGAANQGYAIPISSALRIVTAIKDGRSSPSVHVGDTPFLGILVDGARPGSTPTSGVTIAQVLPNGPAAQAGLVAGDTITAIDTTPVTNGSSLQAAILTFHVGQRVTVAYATPGGTTSSATLTLGSGPAQ